MGVRRTIAASFSALAIAGSDIVDVAVPATVPASGCGAFLRVHYADGSSSDGFGCRLVVP